MDVRRLVALLLVALSVSGCAQAPGKDDPAVGGDLDLQATASTGVIRGLVVDSAIRPIAGATVRLAGDDRTTSTGDDGEFGFDGLSPGAHFVSVEHPDFVTTQQGVEVEAGVVDPPLVRILLAAVERPTPYVEAYVISYFAQVCYPACINTDNPYNGEHGMPIAPNGTVVQAETVWKPTTELGKNLRVGGYTCFAFQQPEGYYVDDVTFQTGPSPLIFRMNATSAEGTADYMALLFNAGNADGLPIGASYNQQIDAYLHVFYNLVPRGDWQFGRDGPYPL